MVALRSARFDVMLQAANMLRFEHDAVVGALLTREQIALFAFCSLEDVTRLRRRDVPPALRTFR